MTEREKEREKLIELLEEADQVAQAKGITDYKDAIADNADHLLSNGVIVPPCKVGDITYIFDYEVNNHLESKFRGIASSFVEAITIEDEGIWVENEHAKYHASSFGDIIFLTKEEAEAKLKEVQG